MVLKEHELLQIDEAYIRRLQAEDPEALAVLSLHLADDLKEAWDRMNQNASNSSRPPGSETPWASFDTDEDDSSDASPQDKSSADDESSAAGSSDGTASDHETAGDTSASSTDNDRSSSDSPDGPRSPGRQPGSPGFGRTQVLAVTQEEQHFCRSCSGCGLALEPALQQIWTGFYCVDVVFGDEASPGLQLTNTLHHYYQGVCPSCGLGNRSEPYQHPPDDLEWDRVALSEWRLLGPGLAALICYLCMDMRLTRQKVVVLLNDVFGLQISKGSIQNCMVESARALSPLEEELARDVLATSELYADETSHKEAGALLWLWVFVTTTTALFLIGPRSKEMWRNLVESVEGGFQGWLMSDGYQVYRAYERRLRCWAHLIRKAKGLEDSYNRQARTYGQQLTSLIEQLMTAIYQAREGPDKGHVSIAKQQHETVQAIRHLCQVMKTSAHKKTRELGSEFLNDWEAIFRILDHPAWPLTNNEAERALRHWVILRRITQGTRSEQGSRALALFASVITTCRLRKASPLLFMHKVIQLRRAGNEVPDLPAVPVG